MFKLFLIVLGIGAVISAILVIQTVTNVDYIEIFLNFFKFGNVPSYPGWVDNVEGFTKTPVPMLMLGYLGTLTISMIPLVGYLGWIKVKGWGIFKDKKDPNKFEEESIERFKKDKGKITYLPTSDNEVKKSRKLMIPLKVDLALAFIIVSVVSAAYVICGVFLLGPQPDGTLLLPTDVNLIEEQARIFTTISPFLKPLFQISVFFAFFGTIYAGFEAAARMIFQTSKNIIPKIKEISYKKYLLYLILYVLATGIPMSIMIYKGLSFFLLLSITLLFIGVIGVLFYGIAVIYMSQKILPEKYKLSPFGLTLGVVAIVLMILPFLAFIYG